MSNKQPEALRLAELFEEPHAYVTEVVQAAAELRRLHALNGELVEALRGIARRCCDHETTDALDALIAKAKAQQ